jgi:hypothetical protein
MNLKDLFKKKDKETIVGKPIVSYSGDFIFKDLPLMKIETLLIAGVGVLAFFGIIISRIFGFMITNYQNKVDPTVFNEIAVIINNVNSINLMTILLVLLVPSAIFAYKFMVLYPRKDKHIVRRRYASGAVRNSVEPIVNNTIKFSTNPEAHDEMSILYPGKNWDITINRPVIDLKEGHTTNSELFTDEDYSRDAQELNDLMTLRFNTGYECGYYDAKNEVKGKPLNKKMLMVVVVVLGLGALVAMYVMKNPGLLGGA